MRAARATTWTLILSLIGLGLSGYLTFLHVGFLRGELLGGAACGSGVFNCHAVIGGKWGTVLGMPLALWGVLGYVAVLALAVWSQGAPEARAPAFTLLTLLATVFVGIDIALGLLMVRVLRVYCLFCALTYGVNLALLWCAWRARPVSPTPFVRALATACAALWPSRAHPAAWGVWGMMLLGTSGVVGLHTATTFVSRGRLGNERKEIREFMEHQQRVSLDLTGDPRIGAVDAPWQLVEFSDFLCQACQRASKVNPILLASHRHDLSFVFKHYPLDVSCNDALNHNVHPGACEIAAASECAHLQGKFWSFHDHLFDATPTVRMEQVTQELESLGLDRAQFTACMESGQGMAAVKRDLTEAKTINVSMTPTYVLNGVPMTGLINPATFEDMLAVLAERR